MGTLRMRSLMKTKQPLQILDLEKDYFSAKFQNKNDYLYALSRGPWTIFGHYLNVRPWTPSLSTNQALPHSLLVWIRLSGLPKGMYAKSLLRFIYGAIKPMAKIDQNTENNSRGQFVKLVVYVELGKLLVLKVKIDGRSQQEHKNTAKMERSQKSEQTSGLQRQDFRDRDDNGFSRGAYCGTTITTKFIRIVEVVNKPRISRKGTLKSKGKGILLEKRSKAIVNKLKPTNKVGASTSRP
ncbi:hypothetical protein GOBAR_AA22965 [Gossypium barbadense]|uniref:DUF4283 domain-containing protein n=1 Tax=Gossypium barbadense TaxID=3634 RepID=A0A2P5X2Z2_GOSBA|nr:hypothetical protein GOBAR_AA22965 [Gossypium barbadense]